MSNIPAVNVQSSDDMVFHLLFQKFRQNNSQRKFVHENISSTSPAHCFPGLGDPSNRQCWHLSKLSQYRYLTDRCLLFSGNSTTKCQAWVTSQVREAETQILGASYAFVPFQYWTSHKWPWEIEWLGKLIKPIFLSDENKNCRMPVAKSHNLNGRHSPDTVPQWGQKVKTWHEGPGWPESTKVTLSSLLITLLTMLFAPVLISKGSNEMRGMDCIWQWFSSCWLWARHYLLASPRADILLLVECVLFTPHE